MGCGRCRPPLVREVKNANNLFNSRGDYLGNGEIVVREGLICPDCKDGFLSCDELLQQSCSIHLGSDPLHLPLVVQEIAQSRCVLQDQSCDGQEGKEQHVNLR